MPAPVPDRLAELGEIVARIYSGFELRILEDDLGTISLQECNLRMRDEGKRVITTKTPFNMMRGPFKIEVEYIDDQDLLIHTMTLWGELRTMP